MNSATPASGSSRKPPASSLGFGPVDALGYKVMMSDREKTAIDCLDHPDLAGGVDEVAAILATASRRFDWTKAATTSNASTLVRSFAASVGWSTTSRPISRRRCARACSS